MLGLYQKRWEGYNFFGDQVEKIQCAEKGILRDKYVLKTTIHILVNLFNFLRILGDYNTGPVEATTI